MSIDNDSLTTIDDILEQEGDDDITFSDVTCTAVLNTLFVVLGTSSTVLSPI